MSNIQNWTPPKDIDREIGVVLNQRFRSLGHAIPDEYPVLVLSKHDAYTIGLRARMLTGKSGSILMGCDPGGRLFRVSIPLCSIGVGHIHNWASSKDINREIWINLNGL